MQTRHVFMDFGICTVGVIDQSQTIFDGLSQLGILDFGIFCGKIAGGRTQEEYAPQQTNQNYTYGSSQNNNKLKDFIFLKQKL